MGFDGLIDQLLHLGQLLLRDPAAEGEVKAQTLSSNVRALLMHLVAQHLAQRRVQQVSRGVQLGGFLCCDPPDHP